MNENKPKKTEENIIIGRNCVLEALKSGRELDALFVARGAHSGTTAMIIAKAKEKKPNTRANFPISFTQLRAFHAAKKMATSRIVRVAMKTGPPETNNLNIMLLI